MPDFLEIDFCKGRALRFARRFDVRDGIESDQLAGATSMGCNWAVSHRASSAPGAILSRVNKQSGADVSDLLISPNESTIANPGPTAWLSAAPERYLNGAATLPFPVTVPIVNPRLFAQGRQVQLPHQTIGFGGGPTGFRSVVVLPPGDLEYLDPGPLANHPARWYYGCVSSTRLMEPYRLTFATQITVTGTRDVYIWQGFPGQGTSRTMFATGNWEHHIGVSVVGIPPALVGHADRSRTPTVAAFDGPLPGAVASNGPEQTTRKFSYPFLGDTTNPDFGNTDVPDFQLSNTRPTLTVFSQSEFDELFGYSIRTIEGASMGFEGIDLPADQYAGLAALDFNFLANGATSFFNSGLFGNPAGTSQGRLYGIVDQAAQMSIDPEATSLTFQIRTADQVPSQPTAEFTIDLPKPAGTIGWFEVVYQVYSRHVGVLT